MTPESEFSIGKKIEIQFVTFIFIFSKPAQAHFGQAHFGQAYCGQANCGSSQPARSVAPRLKHSV